MITVTASRFQRLSLALLMLGLAASAAWAADDHLLLCEGVLKPAGVELIEIKNPTASTVALDDYYLSDAQDYALLPGAFGAGPRPSLHASDFIVRFPAGASLPPEGVVVVALNGAGFEAAFGFKADFEILGTDPATPDMIRPLGGATGSSLTDTGEHAVLFRWDGASDLVEDVDMANFGKSSATNAIRDKTGLAVDGPDFGSTPSIYAAEGATMPLQVATPGIGESTKRVALEGAQEQAGGNGLSGDDETTEDIAFTWDSDFGFIAPDPGVCCLTTDCYYASVDATSEEGLRRTLHAVIAGHVRFPYDSTATGTWRILELADQDPDDRDSIRDVYRNASYPKGDHAAYQREHTWPKSFGFPNESDQPYTDCHALFLADAGYNNRRRNRPYRTCHEHCDEWPTVGGTLGVYPGTSNWAAGALGPEGTWETWMGRRGDVARALFYMDTRYEGLPGEGEPDLVLTDNAALIQPSEGGKGYMGLLSVLLAWHEQDPVDLTERVRDEVVFRAQRNRNPFIDHPEWVGCLYRGDCAPMFADGFESGDTSAWSSTVQ